MNVKRFTARTARDALAMVRQVFGEDAAVLSTRPCADGVEVLAMAPDALDELKRKGDQAPLVREQAVAAGREEPSHAEQVRTSLTARLASTLPELKQTLSNAIKPRSRSTWATLLPHTHASAARVEPSMGHTVWPHDEQEPQLDHRPLPHADFAATDAADTADGVDGAVERDVGELAMSTLSFQNYVHERMKRRRQAAQVPPLDLNEPAPPHPPVPSAQDRSAAAPASWNSGAPLAPRVNLADEAPAHQAPTTDEPFHSAPPPLRAVAARPAAEVTPLRADRARRAAPPPPAPTNPTSLQVQADAELMLGELRSVRGLIEGQLGAMAVMERLKRSPKQAALVRCLLDAGYSPAMGRRLIDSLPDGLDNETEWAAQTLQNNLLVEDQAHAVEEGSGVVALIGSTGVGKTTCTAKMAANFAARHGAGNLGLITLDAYRVGAHEQLRAYGRILGVPVHIAHDRASLRDLLDLLSGKRLVLIDTAGTSQRDSRTRDQLDMLRHKSIQKVLVLNSAQQGETLEDVLLAWKASACRGVVLSKVDEAVKLGPALDALIRHKLKVIGVANGQRVPEDWHHLSAQALVERSLQVTSGQAWRLDATDLNLVVASTSGRGGHLPATAGRA